MPELLLNPLTEREVQAVTAQPSQALLLIAPAGSGKTSLAHYLATKTLGLPEGSTFVDYAYGLQLAPEPGKALGIEAVRQLEHFLRLKVPRQQAVNRVVIIESGQSLTLEAQNALLKLLEEPPNGTLIILTADHAHSLLPTIRSRSRLLEIKRPAESALRNYFTAQGFSHEQISKAYAISGGLPGLMTALLEQADHPLLAATAKARQLLSQTAYERLLSIDELVKQKTLAKDVLFILQQMSTVSLQSAQNAAAQKWQAILAASYAAAESLETNAQPKLVLTELMLQL